MYLQFSILKFWMLVLTRLNTKKTPHSNILRQHKNCFICHTSIVMYIPPIVMNHIFKHIQRSSIYIRTPVNITMSLLCWTRSTMFCWQWHRIALGMTPTLKHGIPDKIQPRIFTCRADLIFWVVTWPQEPWPLTMEVTMAIVPIGHVAIDSIFS